MAIALCIVGYLAASAAVSWAASVLYVRHKVCRYTYPPPELLGFFWLATVVVAPVIMAAYYGGTRERKRLANEAELRDRVAELEKELGL